jgi:hypothetical protein
VRRAPATASGSNVTSDRSVHKDAYAPKSLNHAQRRKRVSWRVVVWLASLPFEFTPEDGQQDAAGALVGRIERGVVLDVGGGLLDVGVLDDGRDLGQVGVDLLDELHPRATVDAGRGDVHCRVARHRVHVR